MKKILQSTSNAFEVDEAAEPVVNPITENARKAGKARQTNSEPHAYKRILVRDWDQKQPCPDDYDSFKQNHQKQYCPKDQSLYRFGSNRNSMSGWFRDLKKVALGENPTGWIVDARAEIEDFEKRSKLLPYEDRIGKKIDKKTDIELAPSMLNGK